LGYTELMRVIQWLDEKRWCSETNYNLIRNKIFDRLTDDKKVLVHWLSYITDRQMPFEKIWTDGGIVFSGIIDEYARGHEYNKLEIFVEKDIEEKIKFRYKENTFASRFVSTDLKSILLTLKILSDQVYGRNILSYINQTFNQYNHLVEKNQSVGANNVNYIAFILYLLSYRFIGNNKPSEGKKEIRDYFDEVNSYYKLLINTLNSQDAFNREYRIFIKARFESKKRVWCCIRDYLKSKEFHKYFVSALEGMENNSILMSVVEDKCEHYHLELPGDVWNMNPAFNDNLVKANLKITSKNFAKELRKTLRAPYYPELFDLTFDFVPRMCANPANIINGCMCQICIFGKSGMKIYCHADSSKACPILMISCGYNVACDKNKCPVFEGVGVSLCREMN